MRRVSDAWIHVEMAFTHWYHSSEQCGELLGEERRWGCGVVKACGWESASLMVGLWLALAGLDGW